MDENNFYLFEDLPDTKDTIKSATSKVRNSNDSYEILNEYFFFQEVPQICNQTSQQIVDGLAKRVEETANHKTKMAEENIIKERRVHRLLIKRQYFDVILNQSKKVELRICYQFYQKIKIGDNFRFTCGQRWLERRISYIHRYRNSVKNCLPHLQNVNEAVKECHALQMFEEHDLSTGVLSFGLEVIQ